VGEDSASRRRNVAGGNVHGQHVTGAGMVGFTIGLSGRVLRTVHALTMLGSDAAFTYAGIKLSDEAETSP
jgi:hypothetical protein